ncbi:hypothetical protein, partial [Helicobacter pylori]|uniref:hypothetical protein n=1 Tax=Helicobacter pylori TaxID=210 RepID=UPI001E32B568
MGSFFSLGKFSNDTQENPKDALKFKNFHEKYTEPIETTELVDKNQKLTAEKDNLTNQLNASQKQVKELEQSQQALKNGKVELTNKITGLSTEKDNLTKEKTDLAEKNKALTTEKEKLNTDLSNAKSQANQTSQKLNELEQRHASYQKLEKLYEVFLEVKDRLNFNHPKQKSQISLVFGMNATNSWYHIPIHSYLAQEVRKVTPL